MDLKQLGMLVQQCGPQRPLIGAGGDDDVAGGDAAAGDLGQEAAAVAA